MFTSCKNTTESIRSALATWTIKKEGITNQGLGYVFFNRDEDKKVSKESLMANITGQIVQGLIHMPDPVVQIFRSHKANSFQRVDEKDAQTMLLSGLKHYRSV